MIAALFVQKGGIYFGRPDVDPWDEERDARRYAGPWPVVAHPPCSRWCRLAGLVEARWGHKRGEDGGCFSSALGSVRRWGGVELPSLRWGSDPDQQSRALVSWCGNHVKSGEVRPRVGKAAAAATPPEFCDRSPHRDGEERWPQVGGSLMDLADIKRRVRLRDLLPAGTRTSGPPDRWRAACVLHGGERLSFAVSRIDGYDVWNCFTCGEGGDVINFVCALHGTDVRGAVRLLGFDDDDRRGPMSDLEKFEAYGQRPARAYPYPHVWFCAGRACETNASSEQRDEPPAGWAVAGERPYCLHCVRGMLGFAGIGGPQKFGAIEGAVSASAGSSTATMNPGPGEMLGALQGEPGNDALTKRGGVVHRAGDHVGVATETTATAGVYLGDVAGRWALTAHVSPACGSHQVNGESTSEPGVDSRKVPTRQTAR